MKPDRKEEFFPIWRVSVFPSTQAFTWFEVHTLGRAICFTKFIDLNIKHIQNHCHRNTQSNVWPNIYETYDPLKLTHEGNHHIHLEKCDLDGGQTTSKGPELFLNYYFLPPTNLLSRLFTRTGPVASINRVCRAWGQPEDSSWRIISLYCYLGHQDLALSSKYPERLGIHSYLASPALIPSMAGPLLWEAWSCRM